MARDEINVAKKGGTNCGSLYGCITARECRGGIIYILRSETLKVKLCWTLYLKRFAPARWSGSDFQPLERLLGNGAHR